MPVFHSLAVWYNGSLAIHLLCLGELPYHQDRWRDPTQEKKILQ